MIPYAKEAGAALILAALAFSHGCVWRMAGSKARAEQAEQAAAYERQLAHAIQVARATERRKALAFAAIAEQTERDKINVQAKHDAVVAGLRSGQLRLRDHWQGCPSVPGAATGPGVSDEGARLRSESAARIVAAAAEADAQVRAAQAVILADRK